MPPKLPSARHLLPRGFREPKDNDKHALFMQAVLAAHPKIFDQLDHQYIAKVMGYNKNVRCASDYVSRFKKSIREGTGGRIQSRGNKKKARRREGVERVVSLETDGEAAGGMGGLLQPSWWGDEEDDENDENEDVWGMSEEEEEGIEIVDAAKEETGMKEEKAGVKAENEVWTWGTTEGECEAW